MAPGDWLVLALNTFSNWKRSRQDLRVFLVSSWAWTSTNSRKFVKNKLQPKLTIHIWIETSKLVDYEYHYEIVQKFLYKANRLKEVLVSKLWFEISHPIVNENAWYKFQTTLQWILYQIPILIEAIIEFDFQPWLRYSHGFDGFKLQMVKTAVAWCCGRWLGRVL